MPKPKRICCYARVREVAVFEAHDFYRTDIQIFRQLGYDVVVTNSVVELLRTRCDIYFAWWFGYGIFAALLGFIRRKPVIVSGVIHTLHCGGLSGHSWVSRSILKLTMKLADCSIFCSKGDAARLEGFRPRNAEIVPLSIDSDLYGFNPGKRDKTILMVTQLNLENVQRKMVLPAIEAFAQFSAKHSEFRLIVCGAIGDGMDAVRACVRDNGVEDRVTYTGRVSLDEKISLLQQAMVYLQPTSCEGFGLAFGEALACGTPVVTSPEVCVVETYGDCVQYGETLAELAQGLSKLVNDSTLYDSMQNLGLSRVQQYSLAQRRRRYRIILEQAGTYLKR